jgi:hypothetical protein
MICKGKEKYLFAMSGRAGSIPHPLPLLRHAESVGGGGGGWQAGSCLGILSGERGSLAINSASCNRTYFWRVKSSG